MADEKFSFCQTLMELSFLVVGVKPSIPTILPEMDFRKPPPQSFELGELRMAL